jgi:NADPH:quinone reductase-like Zn-dependent oxidoreductase
MKVIEFDQFGGPDVLHVVDRPEPAARHAQVLVRIEARSVNAPDAGIREGLFKDWTPQRTFPIVLGADLAGTVLRDSGAFTAGQRVLGMLPWFTDQEGRGSYAEILAAESDWLAPLPENLDAAAATTIPLNGLTAFQAADLLHLAPGETVLVTGASGTVGGFAVQAAAATGATVYAVASDGDEEYAAALGARDLVRRGSPQEIVANLRKLLPEGADAVLDAAPVGPGIIGAVRDGGRFVGVLAPLAPQPERGVTVDTFSVALDPKRLADLAARAADGTLTTRVAARLPLAEAAGAHRLLAAGTAGRGRIVLL